MTPSLRIGTRKRFIPLLILCTLLEAICFGQQPSLGGPDRPPQGPGGPGRHGPGGPGGPGGPLNVGPPGRRPDDPDFVARLCLAEDPQRKMEDTFNTNRPNPID